MEKLLIYREKILNFLSSHWQGLRPGGKIYRRSVYLLCDKLPVWVFQSVESAVQYPDLGRNLCISSIFNDIFTLQSDHHHSFIHGIC